MRLVLRGQEGVLLRQVAEDIREHSGPLPQGDGDDDDDDDGDGDGDGDGDDDGDGDKQNGNDDDRNPTFAFAVCIMNKFSQWRDFNQFQFAAELHLECTGKCIPQNFQ